MTGVDVLPENWSKRREKKSGTIGGLKESCRIKKPRYTEEQIAFALR